MATVKWKFIDPITGEEYTFKINPESMVSATGDRKLSGTSNARGNVIYMTEAPAGPVDWSFTGTVLSKAMLDDMYAWVYGRPYMCQVVDHLGRIYTGYFKGMSATPAKTRLYPYRHAIEVRMLLIGRPTEGTVAESRAGLNWS